MNGTLFVQPHSDDAALSSYFIIRSGILPKPYTLATVFSKSNWINPEQRSSFPPGLQTEKITEIRIAEDRRFAKLLGIENDFFGFLDCPLRHGKVILAPDAPLEENLISQTAETIEKSSKKHKSKNIVIHFPEGERKHCDHRIVYEAALRIKDRFKIYFVDDIPYSRVISPEKNNLRIFKEIPIINLAEKLEAMEIYKSQISDIPHRAQVKKLSSENKSFERIFTLTE